SDNVQQGENEPKVLFVGTRHANEWISSEVPLHLAAYLLNNYNTDPEIQSLVDQADIWFIPVLNPDASGFIVTDDPAWRKNRRPNTTNSDGTNCKMVSSVGVDLNRNYATNAWSDLNLENSTYFSAYCDSDAFKGPAPFSESETQAIRNLMGGM